MARRNLNGRYDDEAMPEDKGTTRGTEERDSDLLGQDLSDEELGFVRKAKSAYLDSTTYMDNSVRRQWEDNLHNFRGEHPSTSKYHSTSYKSRSRLHRNKLRAGIRNHEAAAAAALFTNNDLLSVSAHNQNDVKQEASAKLNQHILQYRLENSIPWFLTAMGAWQDTHVYGICISYQQWEYSEVDDPQYELAYDEDNNPIIDEESGAFMGYETPGSRVLKDEPSVYLLAPENFRFDPNADWRNPVESSPYLIEQMPMNAEDVMSHMENVDPKTGQAPWRKFSQAEILAAGRYAENTDNDTTRQAREGRRRVDPIDTPRTASDEFDIVWVHRVIMRVLGEDFIFYTLGTDHLLTDIQPLEEVFPKGRPYKMGFSILEAHRNYPSSTSELGRDLMQQINEVTNQRRDNVGLALNKRYFIKRQKQGGVDLAALMKNVPGGGVMVDDTEDVKVVETRDVTASSYQEQDRMAVEMDELLGNFSQGSVMNNRKLNETVGGMNLMSSGANMIQELAILMFIKTWMEPVLKDILLLESMFETDEVILATAGQNAELFTKYGVDTVTDELLEQNLSVKVNVGLGNTSPAQKVEKLAMGLNTVSLLPDLMPRLNGEEIGKEIFGYLGFGDGQRFIKTKEQMQEDAQAGGKEDPRLAGKKLELELAALKHQDDIELRRQELTDKKEMALAELALKNELTILDLKSKLGMEQQKNKTVRDMAAVREGNKVAELDLKRETGSGI